MERDGVSRMRGREGLIEGTLECLDGKTFMDLHGENGERVLKAGG